MFKGLKEWFSSGSEKKNSLKELIAYIPVGDLEALAYYVHTHVKYQFDTDTGEEDGKYDELQNYNGAELTLKAGFGDCESKSAVEKEVMISPEWTAKGWNAEHLRIDFTHGDEVSAHDVCIFSNTDGRIGWFEGPKVRIGGMAEIRMFYKEACGWDITELKKVNDQGEAF